MPLPRWLLNISWVISVMAFLHNSLTKDIVGCTHMAFIVFIDVRPYGYSEQVSYQQSSKLYYCTCLFALKASDPINCWQKLRKLPHAPAVYLKLSNKGKYKTKWIICDTQTYFDCASYWQYCIFNHICKWTKQIKIKWFAEIRLTEVQCSWKYCSWRKYMNIKRWLSQNKNRTNSSIDFMQIWRLLISIIEFHQPKKWTPSRERAFLN